MRPAPAEENVLEWRRTSITRCRANMPKLAPLGPGIVNRGVGLFGVRREAIKMFVGEVAVSVRTSKCTLMEAERNPWEARCESVGA